MYVLNENNETVDLNLIPDQVDMHFWVYDNTTHAKDYFCQPLIMLESFYSPTIKLRLSVDSGRRNPTQYLVNVPADYQILIGEQTHGDLEVTAVTSLSGRHFSAFVTNPLTAFQPGFLHIEVEDVLPTIKWFVPKMKTGQLLCVPLLKTPKSPCIFLVRDIPKALEIIKMSDAF